MTDNKFTPGPWTLDGQVKMVGDGITQAAWQLYTGDVRPEGVYRGTICGIQSADQIAGITREEAEANARLIAAAPEMLEIIEQLLGIVQHRTLDTNSLLYEKMRAVVEKAILA